MLLMSKGSKVVFVAYVHNIDTFNAMSKGSKEALTVLIVTHVTHVERVESGVCAYVHNTDTFSAMSKLSKDYVMLKQGTNTFLLITLIFNRFSIRKSLGQLRLRPFQPYHPMLYMSKHVKGVESQNNFQPL